MLTTPSSHTRVVSHRWKKSCQEANFLVSYTKKDTNDSALGGRDEALELAAHNYGRDEWWLLLEPVSG